MKAITKKSAGFTLIEIIVATLILAFVSAITVGSLRVISGSSRLVENVIEVKALQRYPVSVLKDDLQNLYRDIDFKYVRFSCQYDPDDGVQHLKFYTVSVDKARPNNKESDVYEVEYFTSSSEQGSYLMRRYWPNPNDDSEPLGILGVVGHDVIMFDVQMWDGSEWLDEWILEDQRKLPDMIEVGLWFWKDAKDTPQRRSFILTWPRTGQTDSQNEDEPFNFEEKEIAEPQVEN